MGRRRRPPLTPAEVISILVALGFKFDRQGGSHRHYERLADEIRPRSIVTVDASVDTFSDDLMKSMIRQSNHTREEFYGATEKTRRKLFG